MRPRFDPLLHSFRGFSILFIVTIHAFGFMILYAGYEPPKIDIKAVDAINEILFHDSTIFFALISGILFSHVLSDRGWLSFFKNKFLNVALPYLFFTCLFTFFHWKYDSRAHIVAYSGDTENFFLMVFDNLISGGAIFTFWYIPVLLVLYLSTPLISYVLRDKNLRWLMIPLALLPLIISRHWTEIAWANYVYFIGVYAVGLYVGTRYPDIINKLDAQVWPLTAIAIVTTLFLGLLFFYEVENLKFISLRESAWYLQKLAFAGLTLVFVKRHTEKIPGFIHTLGNYAFPIYFIHGYLVYESYNLMARWKLHIDNYFTLALACITELILVILACLLISKLCQWIFKRWSRQIIGA